MNLHMAFELAQCAFSSHTVQCLTLFPTGSVMIENDEHFLTLQPDGSFQATEDLCLPNADQQQGQRLRECAVRYAADNRLPLFLLREWRHLQALVQADSLYDWQTLLNAHGQGAALAPRSPHRLRLSWACLVADAVAGERYALQRVSICVSGDAVLLLRNGSRVTLSADGAWYCALSAKAQPLHPQAEADAGRYVRLWQRDNAEALQSMRIAFSPFNVSL